MNRTTNRPIKIMELLERNYGVYNLKIQNIPIWWFIRIRFYAQLFDFLQQKKGNKKLFQNSNIPLKKIVTHNWMGCGIFLLRSLISLIRITKIKQKSIMFLSYPDNFRGKEDVFIGPIYQRLSDKSINIEGMSLKKQNFYSFLFRKNRIFFDWAILFSILKNYFRLGKSPKIDNWDIFEKRCKEINSGIVPSEWLLKTVKELIISNVKKVFIQLKAAEIILKKFKPKVIVETVSYNSGTVALNLIAKKQNIPIVELQHGLIAKLDIDYGYFLPSDYTGEKPLPDKILVHGEASEKAILGAGNAFLPENIIGTGFPRLSNFLKEIQSKKEFIWKRVRKKLSIDDNIFLVAVTSQITTNNYLSQFFEKTIPLLKEDIVICIKLHPLETENWKLVYGNIANHPQVRVVTDNSIGLYNLLIASDIHTTVYSTTFLECLALGVPNIIIKGQGYVDILELVHQGEIIMVDTAEEFISELNKLRKDSKYREAIIEKGKEISNYFFAQKKSPEELIIMEIMKYVKRFSD